MKICLLGGSNSRLKSGFISGLKEYNEVFELSLGATTSLQNLNQIILHKKSILTSTLIITESNVNDIHATHNAKVPLDIILKNIDAFYYELSKLKKNVIVMIMPLNIKKFKNYATVNNRHIYNCDIYGFALLDLSSKFKDQKNFLEDNLHINFVFIQDLGLRISSSIDTINNIIKSSRNSSSIKKVIFQPNYKYINVTFNEALENINESIIIDQKNSRFSETVLDLNSKNKFSKKWYGYSIVGISTWSNSDSILTIENLHKKIVKPFNELYSFNEFHEEIIIDKGTTIFSSREITEITEKSINIKMKKIIENGINANVLLHSFLLASPEGEAVKLNSKIQLIDLSFLITSPSVLDSFINYGKINTNFLGVLSYYLNKADYDTALLLVNDKKLSDSYVNLFRDTALKIENNNILYAYKLMLVAAKHREKGSLIKRKLAFYKSKLMHTLKMDEEKKNTSNKSI